MRSVLRTPILLTALAAISLAPACSSSGDDDDDTVDATAGTVDSNQQGQIDANQQSQPDANTAAGTEIGDPCTPGGTPEGTCDPGFICANLQGGTTPWCTRPCTDQNDTSCGEYYSGPNVARCFLGITDPETNESVSACVVVCEDSTGANICPDCTGSCEGGLACTPTGNNWSACL